MNSNDIRLSFAVCVFFSANSPSRDDVCPPLRRRLDRFHLHNFYEICIVSSRTTRCFSRRRLLLLLDAVITTRRRGLPPPSAVLSQFRYDIFVVFILTFSAISITTVVYKFVVVAPTLILVFPLLIKLSFGSYPLCSFLIDGNTTGFGTFTFVFDDIVPVVFLLALLLVKLPPPNPLEKLPPFSLPMMSFFSIG